MGVQIVTPYRVSHLQCYGVTVRGNVGILKLRLGGDLQWQTFVPTFRENRPTSSGVYTGDRQTHRQYSKGKAIPLQAWTGPEGSRRLRLPDFKTIGT
jgi:hypothetical protein